MVGELVIWDIGIGLVKVKLSSTKSISEWKYKQKLHEKECIQKQFCGLLNLYSKVVHSSKFISTNKSFRILQPFEDGEEKSYFPTLSFSWLNH